MKLINENQHLSNSAEQISIKITRTIGSLSMGIVPLLGVLLISLELAGVVAMPLTIPMVVFIILFTAIFSVLIYRYPTSQIIQISLVVVWLLMAIKLVPVVGNSAAQDSIQPAFADVKEQYQRLLKELA